MKINPLKFKTLLVFIVLVLTVINISAQEKSSNEKVKLMLAYSKYRDTDFVFISTKHDNDPMDINEVGNIRLSSNYRINRYIDAGLYIGYSFYQTYIPHDFDSLGNARTISYENSHSLMYGLNSNIHILPFFIQKEKSRIDVYASLQYGGIHLFEPEGGINTKKDYAEYGIYGGLAFYPFRHLGFYAEYGYAKYANLRYGLSLKF
ncbi:MAG: hypothetical protein IPM71_10950 [Bacteroidota bacterium]|nr:MAG: hypothetical protein IPM71_10950 [Bacteroidota bacterium]